MTVHAELKKSEDAQDGALGGPKLVRAVKIALVEAMKGVAKDAGTELGDGDTMLSQIQLDEPPSADLGDFAFGCFRLAKPIKMAPPKIASLVADVINDRRSETTGQPTTNTSIPNPSTLDTGAVIDRAVAAGPYVNIFVNVATFNHVIVHDVLAGGSRYGANQANRSTHRGIQTAVSEQNTSQHYMVEYSSPNTNKPLHLGHLRNNLLGNAIAKMLSFYGHTVTRVNLVNDRGIHICKSMIAYQLSGETPDSPLAGAIGPEPAVGASADDYVGRLYVAFESYFQTEYAAWQPGDAATAAYAEWKQALIDKALQKAKAKHLKKAKKAKETESPPFDEDKVKRALSTEAESTDTEFGKQASPKAFFKSYKDTYFNTHSELGQRAQKMLRAWEAKDPNVRALWRKMNDWVLAGHDVTYARLGVGFDLTQLESETYLLGKALVEDGLTSQLFVKRADGAIIYDLSTLKKGTAAGKAATSSLPKTGEKVLLRADGTSVYMTQDLGTAISRYQDQKPDRIIYVVGDEQNYHFDLLFNIVSQIEPKLDGACAHLAYGMIRLPDGKMKSREGTVVDANELLQQMHDLAYAEGKVRVDEGRAHSIDISDQDIHDRAEIIGLAALKYFLLKFSPRTSFEYDPKASIDFHGQTGPYCLFNYARTRSIVNKARANESIPISEWSADLAALLTSDIERKMIRQLFDWPNTLEQAIEGLDPSRICEYVYGLARSFAHFFTDKESHPILTCTDHAYRSARVHLANAVGHCIAAGLSVVGIDVLEEM